MGRSVDPRQWSVHPDAPTIVLPPVPDPVPPPRHRLRRVAVAWAWALAFAVLATCTAALLLIDWALYQVA